jgi:hypothetical protein
MEVQVEVNVEERRENVSLAEENVLGEELETESQREGAGGIEPDVEV